MNSAPTFVAFLRGINVGGKNKLPMRELVEVLADLGLSNVETYIQSGNVVFQGESANTSDLPEKISAALAKSHGFSPQVLVLKGEELEAAVAANPFVEAESEPKTLHLYFLMAEPEQPDLKLLEKLKTDTERFALTKRVFYLHAPDGIGRSKLAAKVERALGVPVTARNWRSVTKVLSMSEAL